MRTSRSRHFFDLEEAVQLSRKLSCGTRQLDNLGTNATPLRRRQSVLPPGIGDNALPEPLTSDATNAMALWQILLDWARDIVGADGAFALERSGFRIAAVGNLAPFPPEIFSEAFASASRLFDVYLSGEMGISGVSLSFETIGRVALFPLMIDDMSVLLGLSAKGPIKHEMITKVRHTISSAVTRFELDMDISSEAQEQIENDQIENDQEQIEVMQ